MIVAAAAVLSGGLAVTATPTGATTQPTVQVTQSQHEVITPASCTTARNYKGGYATFTYCNGQYNREPCSGTWVTIFGPLYAANGCSTRLYMWTSGGYNLCVNPQSSTNALKRDYTSAEITRITSNCGT